MSRASNRIYNCGGQNQAREVDVSDKLNNAREWNIVWSTPGNLEVHNTKEKICFIRLGETVHVIEAAPVLAKIAELESHIREVERFIAEYGVIYEHQYFSKFEGAK